jgi:two-component system nitrate/nitrite response regulator NarL
LVHSAQPTGAAQIAAASIARNIEQPLSRIPVIIVESNLLFRAGLVHILAGSQFRVVAEGSSLADVPPDIGFEDDCILLVALGKDDAGTITPGITTLRERFGGLHVVVLCDELGRDLVSQLGNLVNAYFLKNEIGPAFILRSLEMILLGATIFPRQVFEEMLNGKTTPAGQQGVETAAGPEFSRAIADGAPGSLSTRERCILSHIMRGASNKHIARALGITEATVKVHVKNMLLKINAKNRTQAAMWGMKYQAPADK